MDNTTVHRLASGEIQNLQALLALYIDVFGEPVSPNDTSYLDGLLQNQSIIFLVAQHGATIVGGLTAYLLPSIYGDYSELYIYDMAVATDHQRHGIGTTLLDFLKQYAKTINVRDIYVQADANDTGARNFYKKNGGTEEDVRHYDFKPS